MKKILLSALLASMTVATGNINAASAGFGGGGGSPLGENPDQYITIAQRQQLKRLKRSGKIKNVYQFSPNRLIGLEEEAYQERYDARKRRKFRRK